MKGENKQLGLFGSYVDIFRGIPFAAPTKTLQDPEPHPGWDGKIQLLNAYGLGFSLLVWYFHLSLFNLVHMGNGTTYYSDCSQWLGRLCCHCIGLREERMGEQTPCNQRIELMTLTRTCCLPFLLLGTLEAKEFKPRCMQMKLTQTDVRGSEDCLYLNIWIPQGRRQSMCWAGTWAGYSHLPCVHS